MARLPRVYIEGILYYVTSKGGHSQDIFADASDYREYISLMAQYKKQYGFKLFSYALLPNHLHMLIELKNNVGISSIMHDINSLYTKTYNSRYNRKGHLFQERFKTVLAEKEAYLLRLTRHIHLNPKRLKLVDDPKDYPYSSHSHFLDPAKRGHPDMRREIEEIFKALNGWEEAFSGYVGRVDRREANELKKALQKRRILGSREFAERIGKAIEEGAKRQKMERLPKRVRVAHVLLGGTAILFSVITATFFYHQSGVFKNEFQKSLKLYQTTLDMLRRERDRALKAEKDAKEIKEYEWKIRLAERALEALKEAHMLDGYAWDIEFTQVGGPKAVSIMGDAISFENNRISSKMMRQAGFSSSNYTKRMLPNGNVVWETIQTNKRGESASWRGEWDGKVMKGILRRRSADGVIRDFSFINVGSRTENRRAER